MPRGTGNGTSASLCLRYRQRMVATDSTHACLLETIAREIAPAFGWEPKRALSASDVSPTAV